MALEDDFGVRVNQYAQQTFPAAYADRSIGPITAPRELPDLTARGQTSGQKYPDYVMSLQTTQGSKLTPQQLMDARGQFKAQKVLPAAFARKGATQGSVAAYEQQFDALADQWEKQYLASGQDNQAQPIAQDGWSGEGKAGVLRTAQGLKDTAVQAVTSGTLGTLEGIASLIDLGIRGNTKLLKDVINPIEAFNRKQEESRRIGEALYSGDIKGVIQGISAASLGGTTPTVAKSAAQGLNELRQSINKGLVSESTQQKQQEFGTAFENEGLAEALKYGVQNPTAFSSLLGDTLGMLIPANLTGKAKAVQAISSAVGKRVIPTLAASEPIVGRAALEYQTSIENTPVEELIKSPRFAELYEQMNAALPELGITSKAEIDKLFKQEVAAQGIGAVVATSQIANAILPMAQGRLSPEAIVAGLGRRVSGRAGQALRVGAAEALEEGAASGIEQLGTNAATDQDLSAGVGANVGLGAVVGTAVGAGLGALQRRNPLVRQDQPAANEPPTNEPPVNEPAAGTTAAEAAPPQATDIASITQTPGTGVDEKGLQAANTLLDDTISKALAKKSVQKTLPTIDAEGIIEQAISYAQKATGQEGWGNLSADQRLGLVERAASALNDIAKKDGVGTTLQAIRNGLQAPITPAAPITETSTPEPQPVQQPTPATDPVDALLQESQAVADAYAAYLQDSSDGGRALRNAVEDETGDVELADAIQDRANRERAARPPAPAPAPVPTPAPTPAPAPTAAPIPSAPAETAPTPTLPDALSKAKPRYSNGSASYAPEFESDIDRALFIISNKNGLASKSNQKYVDWLTEVMGLQQDQLAPLAAQVREHVRSTLSGKKGGTSQSPTKVKIPNSGIQGRQLPSPKTEAPASVSEPGPAQQPAPQVEQTRESAEQAAMRIFGEDVTSEVPEYINLAREGDDSKLREFIKEGEWSDGTPITKEQAKQLREAAKSLKPSERGEGQNAKTPTFTSSKDLWNHAIANKWNMSQLFSGIANLPEISTIEKWLANKLASVLEKSGAKIRNLTDKEIDDTLRKAGLTRATGILAGQFDNDANELMLNPDADMSVETLLHEGIHAAIDALITMAPADARIAKAQKDLDTLFASFRSWIRQNKDVLKTDRKYRKFIYNAAANPAYGTNDLRELVTWGLTNREFSEVLAKAPAPKGFTVRNAWEAFKQIVADFLGIDTEQGKTALDSLIELVSDFSEYAEANPEKTNALRASMRKAAEANNRRAFNPSVIDRVPAVIKNHIEVTSKPVTDVDVSNPSFMQQVGEKLANAGYGIERSIQMMQEAGGVVNEDNNPYFGMRKYLSDISEHRDTDIQEVVEPLRNWIAKRWQDFRVIDQDDFRKRLDQFLQNYHMAYERMPSLWAETVKLKGNGELTRAELVEDAYNGDITPQELQTKLKELATQKATKSFEEWGGEDLVRRKKILGEVAKLRFTPHMLADLQPVLQAISERAQQRNIQGGLVSESDPFRNRDWKWYVPMKGVREGIKDELVGMDFGFDKAKAKEFRGRYLKAIEKGRTGDAYNALEQMLIDLGTAGTAAAEGDFQKTLYEYITDNQALLGAKIRRWTGTPKQGYETSIGNDGKPLSSPRHANEIPAPKNGLVISMGDTHYEIELPEGSQLDRGVKGLRKIVYPSDLSTPAAEALQIVGTLNNFLARSYTTWSPTWQLGVAFLRDLNALPLTIAAEKFSSPWAAKSFLAKYTTNVGKNIFNVPELGEEAKWLWTNNMSGLRKAADDNPNGLAARVLRYRQAGGNTQYTHSFNRESAKDVLFGRKQNALGNLARVYDKVNDVTGNWAAALEMRARVAAFEALISEGVSKQEAAALTKGAMDFQQSGEWGKIINSILVFSRVGFTQADVFRRMFSTPTGKLDKAKLAKWGSTLGAIGAMYYMALAAALGYDDDELDENGQPTARIKKYDASTLATSLLVPTGDGDVIKVPLGYGLPQMLLAPGMLAGAVNSGHKTPEEAAKAYYEVITRNTPIQPAGWKEDSGPGGLVASWLMGLAPSTARPLLEAFGTNTNAWGGSIVTPYPKEGAFKSESGKSGTADEWKDIAKGIRELSGIDMYPEQIKHLTLGYGGQTVGDITRWAFDLDNKEKAGLPSEPGRMAIRQSINDPQFYYAGEANRVKRELNVSKRLANAEGENEAAWLAKHPKDAKRIAAWKALDKAEDKYYKEIKKIRENKLLSIEGRQSERKKADSRLREAVNQAKRVLEATE